MSVDARLLEILARAFPGSIVERTWPLRGGVSRVTHAAQLGGPRRETVVVGQVGAEALRRDPSCVTDEARLLELLHRAGAPVPEVLHVAEQDGRARAIVVRFVDGISALHVTDGVALADAFAAELVAIHAIAVPERAAFGFLAARQRQHGAWLAGVADSPDVELREPEIRARIRAAPAPAVRSPCLLHGDFWPGNVLWSGGRIAAVLDWEDAMLGAPALDVAIARLDLLWAFDLETMQRFTRAYADRTSTDLSDLPYWDLCAALRPLGALSTWAAAWPALDRPDVTAERIRDRHQHFVDAALRSP